MVEDVDISPRMVLPVPWKGDRTVEDVDISPRMVLPVPWKGDRTVEDVDISPRMVLPGMVIPCPGKRTVRVEDEGLLGRAGGDLGVRLMRAPTRLGLCDPRWPDARAAGTIFRTRC